jgi:hypothetical protein
MRGLAIPLGCVLAYGLPAAQARPFDRTAAAGQTTKIYEYHSRGDSNCAATAGVVKVLSKPSHGTITHHAVNSIRILNHQGKLQTHCFGTPVKAFVVDYTPAPGFHGIDKFSLDVTWGREQHDIDTYTVKVH